MTHNPSTNQLHIVETPTEAHFYTKINFFKGRPPTFSVFFK